MSLVATVRILVDARLQACTAGGIVLGTMGYSNHCCVTDARRRERRAETTGMVRQDRVYVRKVGYLVRVLLYYCYILYSYSDYD